MSKIIENSDFLREKIKKCLDLRSSSDHEQNFLKQIESALDEDYVDLDFIKNFKNLWNESFPDEKIYLHQILSKSKLYLPKYVPEPRNPELEKRVQALKDRFENEQYQQMVYNIDHNSPLRLAQDKSFMDGYSADFKTIQGQIIVIINAVACIVGSFYFGYKAVYYSLDEPNINYQMIGGFLFGLTVAFAEIWFLFKKLNEMDNLGPKKMTKKPVVTAVIKSDIFNKHEIKSPANKKED